MKVIKASKLVDVNGVVKDPILVINEGIIEDVGPDVTIPDDAEVIDAGELTLIPGLIDCHIHLYGHEKMGPFPTEPTEIRLFRAVNVHCKQIIDSGFTTVQDCGSVIGLWARNAINSGYADGPRIKASNRAISQTAGHSDAVNVPSYWAKDPHYVRGFDGYMADGVPECLRAVRENLRVQADFIKICSGGGGGGVVDPWWVTQYTVEEMKAIVDASHSYGKKVMSHVYAPDSILRTIEGGIDIITHGNMADDECVKMMKENGTWFVPTMNVYERFTRKDPEKEPSVLYEPMFKAVKKAWDAGVHLSLGTDNMGFETLPHGGSALEMELYVDKVGLTPMEALKIATINGAKTIGMEDELGTLEKGKLADVVAVDGNFLKDIKLLQNHDNIKLVLKEGKVLKSLL
jgi:imidazolonepropionase-like amidohydrolase